MLGIDSETLSSLVTNIQSTAPEKLRDIFLFGLKCSRNPQSLEESDFKKLKDHGLKQSEIVEIIGMACLAVYATTLADATGMMNEL